MKRRAPGRLAALNAEAYVSAPRRIVFRKLANSDRQSRVEAVDWIEVYQAVREYGDRDSAERLGGILVELANAAGLEHYAEALGAKMAAIRAGHYDLLDSDDAGRPGSPTYEWAERLQIVERNLRTLIGRARPARLGTGRAEN